MADHCIHLFVILTAERPAVGRVKICCRGAPLPSLNMAVGFRSVEKPLASIRLACCGTCLGKLSPTAGGVKGALICNHVKLTTRNVTFVCTTAESQRVLSVLVHRYSCVLCYHGSRPNKSGHAV